jgi:hypothetical protein
MYAGDPGIFGFLGKALRTVTGIASKVLPGPLGALAGGVSSALGGVSGQQQAAVSATPALPPLVSPVYRNIQEVQRIPEPGLPATIQRWIPGGETGFSETEEEMRAGRGSRPGFHWNKSGYFLKTGEYIRPGTKEVRNRRRNSLNPRALDRALGRVTGAKRASKKLARVTIRKPASCR